MTPAVLDAMRAKLDARAEAQSLRRLRSDVDGPDFCSNDYLALARSDALRDAIRRAEAACGAAANGATGSRLISGNSARAEALEALIARHHRAEAALVFATGYAANTGLFACLLDAGDTLVLDELIHASMIDGARLSKAQRLIFRHNDLADLEAKLAEAEGHVVVGVESLYSMDGDETPLPDLVALAERFGAAVVVDEAHSTGVYGPAGAGTAVRDGIEDRLLARVCTFGKALGVHGAAVVGSATLREYLINFARPFIYSTAPPPAALAAVEAAYGLLPELDDARRRLFELIDAFRARAGQSSWDWLDSTSAIQSVLIPGNDQVRAVAAELQRAGLGVVPIVAPTVPAGAERIRICLHSHNSHGEIDRLFDALEEARAA
ncbi:MAG: aminotransferase class I/II-fold pyridoxal phosphate-dependent enzyme [Pseudomonadota bacterium]